MTDKKVDTIDGVDFWKIHIQDATQNVQIDPADIAWSDIDTKKRHTIPVERKHKNTAAIDLTGVQKTKISGIQADIQWPDQKQNLWDYIVFIKRLGSSFWRHIPLIVRVPLSVFVLGCCLLLFLFFLQYRITTNTYEAYDRIVHLKDASDITTEIQSIRKDFHTLTRNFSLIHIIGNNLFVSNPKIQDAHNIIEGGYELTQWMEKFWNLFIEGQDVYKQADANFITWLEKQKPDLKKIHTHLQKATQNYNEISENSFSDPALAKTFTQKREQLSEWGHILKTIINNYDQYLLFLGAQEPKNILILNQNQDELRASWGFPGSVGMLQIYEGRIESWEMKDIYALDWNLFPTEPSPEGINQFKEYEGSNNPINLNIRDANYYPLFHESAVKINELMQQAQWSNIDMLVGINQSIIQNTLKVTGPIDVPELPLAITSENFNTIISSLVESKSFAQNSPKDILFSFSEQLFQQIKAQNSFNALLQVAWRQLKNGEILIAHVKDEEQKYIDDLRFFEPWRYDNGDWIYPVFTSVSKNKSDRHMHRSFFIKQNTDYLCTRRFELIQAHKYDSKTDFEIERIYRDLDIHIDLEALKHVQGKGINKQYIRLLLPAGSTLTNSHGFSLDETQADTFTQIAWYQTTPTGSSSHIYFDYRPPAHLCETATWMYKQPGLARTSYTLSDTRGATKTHIFE